MAKITSKEQEAVIKSLGQMGFVGISPFDYIWKFEPGLCCAVPYEETDTFDRVIRYLGDGFFQITLNKATRYNYFLASQRMMGLYLTYQELAWTHPKKDPKQSHSSNLQKSLPTKATSVSSKNGPLK